MRWVILAIGLVAAVPASAADQFDLVCTSKKTVTRYRVDLAKMEWCHEDCRGVVKIAEVTSSVLTLLDNQPKFENDGSHSIIINRQTGDWLNSISEPRSSYFSSVKGTCTVAPFSGFPAAKF